MKLRSRILQQEMTKEMDDVKITCVEQNEKETKEKLIEVTHNI